MLNLFKSFLLIIVNLINIINCQALEIPNTPCKSVFNYKIRTNSNETYGYLKFMNDYSGDYQLEVRMSIAIRTNEKIRIIRLPTEESIQCGADLEYEVVFPLCDSLIPVLTFVKFNNKIYCTGSQDIYDKVTTQLQEYDALVTDIEENSCERKSTSERTSLSEMATISTSANMNSTTTTPSIIRNKYESVTTCGKLNEASGETAIHRREHFPWLATIYYLSKQNTQYPTYICSGALISNRYVITIATCVANVDKANLTIRLGSNNIKQIVPSTATTVRQVANITIHPKYDRVKGYVKGNNIAIIGLERPVVFDDLISPVCLWTGNDDLDDVVGSDSITIGYGSDAKPKKFIMPIVSQIDCISSHEVYATILENTSFCAGKRDGVVPCIGNLGGSLLISQPDGKYYLRGLVTVGIKDKDSNCDGYNYIMFTDVAKFAYWISSIVSS